MLAVAKVNKQQLLTLKKLIFRLTRSTIRVKYMFFITAKTIHSQDSQYTVKSTKDFI